MALVRNDTFGVLALEPSGPYSLLDAVAPETGMGLWPAATTIAQTFACADVQPVGHACGPLDGFLPVPEFTAASALGGTIAAGTYYVTVTASNANGETTAATAVAVVVAAADSQITVTIDPAVEGATGYNVYLGDAADSVLFAASSADLEIVLTTTDTVSIEPPDENTAAVPYVKRFDGLDQVDGYYVTLQGGIACGALGLSGADGLAYAEALFRAREAAGIEREFLRHVLADSGAVDITPSSGPVLFRTGLAMAEGYGISHYAGKPYLHTPATVGSALFGLGAAGWADGKAQTKLGNPLVVGAGYDYPSVGPDGVEPTDGSFWIYVTGRPLIARGELNVIESLNTTTNEQVVLAERPYLVAADCMVAAVNVTLEG